MQSLRGIRVLIVLMGCFAAGLSQAQNYPTKPVRILTGPVGGGTDLMARVLSTELSTGFGQSVVVDNRPAGPPLAAAVMQSAPDGYTLNVNGTSLWIAPLFDEVSYDPVRDFAPVTMLARVTTLLVVHPSLNVKNVAELVALAKAKPGQINIASGPPGGTQHITAELFKSLAGIDLVSVPFKGGPQQDVLAGRVQVTFNPPGVWGANLKAGKVVALASTGDRRSALFPDLPTVAETLPGYEAEGKNALFVPARTPEAIIRRVNQETLKVLQKPDVRDRLLATGQEPAGGSPEQLATLIKDDVARVTRLVKTQGIAGGR